MRAAGSHIDSVGEIPGEGRVGRVFDKVAKISADGGIVVDRHMKKAVIALFHVQTADWRRRLRYSGWIDTEIFSQIVDSVFRRLKPSSKVFPELGELAKLRNHFLE